jgi:hypothetical protein
MPVTEKEFVEMNPAQRKRVLGQLRLEADFKALPSEDRKNINTILKVQKDEPMTKIEATARGAAQGLAFGFADEIAAGLSAAGQAFLSKKEFKPAFEKALLGQRERDKLAEAKFPELFATGEVGGAVAGLAIPIGGQLGVGAKALKMVKPTKNFFDMTRGGISALTKVPGKSVIGKILGIAPEQIGKGIGRGVTGIGKASAGGAVTALGKAQEKTLEEAKKGAIIGGVTGLAAGVAGPIARGIGKTAIKSPRLVGAVLSGGKSEIVKGVLNKVKKGLSSQEAVAQRLDALAKLIESPASKLETGAVKFLDILGEAFEKQGGAGIVTAHISMLDDPGYSDFLDKVEKQKGLTVPKKGKK